jgi:hypothetical protein
MIETSSIHCDYAIDGTVNALQKVRGAGTGLTDTERGETTLTVEFTALPDSWDPRTIVMMCCLRSLVMGSVELGGAVGMYRASGGQLTMGHHLDKPRDFVLFNDSGELLVRGHATSITDFRPERGVDRSTTTCTSRIKPGVNGISRLRPFEGLMQQVGPNLIMVTTVFEAEMEDGTLARGTTNYPHWLPEPRVPLPGPQILRVTKIEQTFDGGRLHLVTQTEVEPLVLSRAARPYGRDLVVPALM